MKKIGLITTNRLLAQSLNMALGVLPNLELELIQLQKIEQALIDAEVLQIDIAVINLVCCSDHDNDAALTLCTNLRRQLPFCKILMLVAQENKIGKHLAMDAKVHENIDDFIFYDTSLDYLITKFVDL